MNFEFVEGGKAEDKVIQFGGVRVSYKKVVHDEGEGGGVSMVAEEHKGGSF
jgi:hypothetical protein